MIVLITGGSGSGKSEYAEKTAVTLWKNAGEDGTGDLIYLATMKPEGHEAGERIKRHRALRQGKGFTTMECQCDLQQAASQIGSGRPTLLLECMSNLTANEMFWGSFTASQMEDTLFWKERENLLTDKIEADLEKLAEKCQNLVIVTNDVFDDGGFYDTATESYLHLLGRLNRFLAQLSDQVVEVVFSCPVILKQKEPEFSERK